MVEKVRCKKIPCIFLIPGRHWECQCYFTSFRINTLNGLKLWWLKCKSIYSMGIDKCSGCKNCKESEGEFLICQSDHGAVDCLISKWVCRHLEQIQWIMIYMYIQNGISWILSAICPTCITHDWPDKTWNGGERNVAIGLPGSAQWKWRENMKWMECNGGWANENRDRDIMMVKPGIGPQFITLRCQDWCGEKLKCQGDNVARQCAVKMERKY